MVAAPAALAAASVGWAPPERSTKRLEKSTLPTKRPTGGMRISFTKELTILPKAAPIMIPIAMSRTFPRIANSLNSFIIYAPPLACARLPRLFLLPRGYDYHHISHIAVNRVTSTKWSEMVPHSARQASPVLMLRCLRVALKRESEASSACVRFPVRSEEHTSE